MKLLLFFLGTSNIVRRSCRPGQPSMTQSRRVHIFRTYRYSLPVHRLLVKQNSLYQEQFEEELAVLYSVSEY